MKDRIRLGLLGCGTVGSAILRAVTTDRRLADRYQVTAIAVRDTSIPRTFVVAPGCLTTTPMDVATSTEVDVVVEVMGGHDPAHACIDAALTCGKPVVTANKALLAEHGETLFLEAERLGVPLRFEAAVAGAVPVIRTLRELRRHDTVRRIDAVLNGTTTFVLAAMATHGMGLNEAVAEAQVRGYAEADSARDLDGRDAADKITLLARLLWGSAQRSTIISDLRLDALTPASFATARADDEAWQVVASATPRSATVSLTRLPLGHPFSRLTDTDNAVRIEGRRTGTLTLVGPGAGGDATTSSILADLDDLHHRRQDARPAEWQALDR